MRFYRLVLSVFVLTVFFSWGAAAQSATFKIGVCGPYTGSGAAWGDNMKIAIKEAFSRTGNMIGSYDIEIVWIDTEGDPAKGTAALAEAIERQGIDIIFHNIFSEVAVALIDLAAQYKVPYFGGSGATGLINEKYLSDPEKYKYYGGKAWPTAAKLVSSYMDLINTAYKTKQWKPANRKVVIYASDNGWGRTIGETLRKQLTETGWEIVMEEYLTINQVDHYPLIAKIQKTDAALLAGTLNNPPLAFSFVKQLDEMGYDGLVIAEALNWAGNWYEMTGKASNYLLDMGPQYASKESIAWADHMEKTYDFRPSAAAGALTYDFTNFLIKGLRRTLEKHNKLDRDSFLEVMLSEITTGKLTFTMAEGALLMKEYQFTRETMPDLVVGPDHFVFPVVQYMDGNPTIIYPPHLSQADLQLKK